jgi:UDP-GlcNAc:undecaprenyl-phosphate GlcNAc-1-phosphate transferase
MLLTIALTPIFCWMALRWGFSLDVPDERKMHRQPIPRVGGFAITLGIIASMAFWGEVSDFVKAVFMGGGVIVFLGLVDDIRGLRFRTKFAGQLAASFLVIFVGGFQITDLGTIVPGVSSLSPFVSIPLTAFVIVGVTNAINLADGLDGLAGGICMLSFFAIAYFAHSLEVFDIAFMALAVSGAIFGFLRFNTYPSTIFMGDTGSQLLGFLVVTLSLKLTQNHGPVSPFVPLMIVGFPIIDTLVVMTERIAAGKCPFLPDKNHLHHKLIKLGFFHSEAVISLYFLQVIYVTSAYIFRFYTDGFVLSAYLIFSALVVSLLLTAERSGYQIKRFFLFDKIIKGKLHELKENNLLIKISFRFILVSLPLLLLFTCIVPARFPPIMEQMSLVSIILLLGIFLLKKDWLSPIVRTTLFIMIPFVVYFSEVDPGQWISAQMYHIYEVWGVVTILFIILTMKLTRRSDRLKATPLHILILLMALIIPNLPGASAPNFHLGMVAVKIIFFFFGFEVLFGELRDKMNWLGLVSLLSFVTLLLKSNLGF